MEVAKPLCGKNLKGAVESGCNPDKAQALFPNKQWCIRCAKDIADTFSLRDQAMA